MGEPDMWMSSDGCVKKLKLTHSRGRSPGPSRRRGCRKHRNRQTPDTCSVAPRAAPLGSVWAQGGRAELRGVGVRCAPGVSLASPSVSWRLFAVSQVGGWAQACGSHFRVGANRCVVFSRRPFPAGAVPLKFIFARQVAGHLLTVDFVPYENFLALRRGPCRAPGHGLQGVSEGGSLWNKTGKWGRGGGRESRKESEGVREGRRAGR